MDKKLIIKKLKKDLCHSGYITNFFKRWGLPKLYVGEGTLGPEMSWVSYLLTKYLLTHPELCKGKKILDMGTGSGAQAVAVATRKAKSVLGVDISSQAVSSLIKNIKLLGLNNVSVLKSDLFSEVPKQIFDVIIFNHPFLSGVPKNSLDGIYIAPLKTIQNFFKQAPKYLKKTSLIIMPFAHIGDHNPERLAKEYGFKIYKEIKFKNKFGKQSIYIL